MGQLSAGRQLHGADASGDEQVERVRRTQAVGQPAARLLRRPRAVRAGELVIADHDRVHAAWTHHEVRRDVHRAGRIQQLGLDAGQNREPVGDTGRRNRIEEFRDPRGRLPHVVREPDPGEAGSLGSGQVLGDRAVRVVGERGMHVVVSEQQRAQGLPHSSPGPSACAACCDTSTSDGGRKTSSR